MSPSSSVYRIMPPGRLILASATRRSRSLSFRPRLAIPPLSACINIGSSKAIIVPTNCKSPLVSTASGLISNVMASWSRKTSYTRFVISPSLSRCSVPTPASRQYSFARSAVTPTRGSISFITMASGLVRKVSSISTPPLSLINSFGGYDSMAKER